MSKVIKLEKQKITKAIEETTRWVDHNRTAEKDEVEFHQTHLEEIVNPIMQKVYAAQKEKDKSTN